jgi:hypothetical protein
MFNVHIPTWIDFDINLFWIVGTFMSFSNIVWWQRDTSKSWMMYNSNEIIIGMHELINLYLTQWLFINSKRKGDWKGKENCSHFQVSKVVLISLMMSSLCSITYGPFASNIPHYTTHLFDFYLFMFYQPKIHLILVWVDGLIAIHVAYFKCMSSILQEVFEWGWILVPKGEKKVFWIMRFVCVCVCIVNHDDSVFNCCMGGG